MTRASTPQISVISASRTGFLRLCRSQSRARHSPAGPDPPARCGGPAICRSAHPAGVSWVRRPVARALRGEEVTPWECYARATWENYSDSAKPLFTPAPPPRATASAFPDPRPPASRRTRRAVAPTRHAIAPPPAHVRLADRYYRSRPYDTLPATGIQTQSH